MTTWGGLYTRQGGAIPLRGVEVTGEILGAHARVRVRQRYRNAEARPIEAVYTFPLPADATLTAFAMTCAGRTIEGVVREREAAFRAYDDAVVAGHGAALLEQERGDVFTASVGNLLPGEETTIDVEYVQRVQADEGALRWMLPTLVAPRYIPGTTTGDRTADGAVAPTDRVPDADRVTPRAGDVDYGLRLDLVVDLGRDAVVESPSHAVAVARDGRRARVTFTQGEVALDRDVVIVARGVARGPLATVAAHRAAGAAGALSLSVVPDLAETRRRPLRQDVVFLIDTSGSMAGDAMREARAALRLCLRHLREGDRFNVVAFASTHRAFAREPVRFDQGSLERADAWVEALVADGGTDLLEPLAQAVAMARDGVVVLLTDGQVGNEREILQRALAARGKARVYSFGIGTNVSDALLRDLARHTGAAVEFIHPGERIDEKVVAQFARAIAARVTEVSVRFTGVDVGEVAPTALPDLVDGEPWSLFARYERGGSGHAEVLGLLDGEPFTLEVPLDLPETAERPVVMRLWAAERIRDLEAAELAGRRADAMRERLVRLAVEHGIVTKHTAFVVVETRTGARRASDQPETRVVPVNLPAGWAMFDPTPVAKPKPAPARGRWVDLTPPPPASRGPSLGGATEQRNAGGAARAAPPSASAAGRAAPPAEAHPKSKVALKDAMKKLDAMPMEEECDALFEAPASSRERAREAGPARSEAKPVAKREADEPLVALLARQSASGLWDDAGAAGDDAARALRATARALVELRRRAVTTVHPVHGAQVRKAVEAVVALASTAATSDPDAAGAALAAAWRVTTGQRTRAALQAVVDAHPALAPLRALLSDDAALAQYVDQKLGAP